MAAEDFRAVLEGHDPATGERLKRFPNLRVAGWDVTLSPPKSVSALWARAPDAARDAIQQAQAAAVDAAIGYLTREACVARLGRGGSDRQDGAELGFLRCDFTHRCSREGDPQLHTHVILANVLQDEPVLGGPSERAGWRRHVLWTGRWGAHRGSPRPVSPGRVGYPDASRSG